MKVRDRTMLRTEYKGRETDACERECPCRPCYCPHDWGRPGWDGKVVSRMVCNTRENNGCPSPQPEPQHVYVSDRAVVCKRCGHRRRKGET